MSADATRAARALSVACLISALFVSRAQPASAQPKPNAAPAAASAQTAPAQPGTTEEGEEAARKHFRLGRAYYDNGDFAQAAVEFEEAYRISQRAALLYNIYLAYRDASDMRHAADALRKYLELEHNIENRGQLEARLTALDRTLAEEATNPTPAPPSPTPAPGSAPSANPIVAPAPLTATAEASAPPVSAEPEHAAPVTTSSRNLTVPLVLMASGGALMAGSLVTGILTLGKRGDLSDAQTQCEKLGTCNALSPARARELNDERSSGKTLATITDVLLFGGLAVAGTGVVLLLLGSNDERADRASASVMCGPGACAGHVAMRF